MTKLQMLLAMIAATRAVPDTKETILGPQDVSLALEVAAALTMLAKKSVDLALERQERGVN